MRTQVMQEYAVGTSRLEHDSPTGVEKTHLESFPFTIGRNDSADLHIDSNEVSREHAVITRHGKKFRVRDLGSTNGTFLNGEQIEEATLSDGDLLVIAGVEFTFFCDSAGAARETATQVTPSPARHRAPAQDKACDAILAVRRTHEAVVQRSLRTLFQGVVELASGEAIGYEAFASSGAEGAACARCEQLTAATECRATDRLRQLFRRLAAEESVGLPYGARLFLAITGAESAAGSLLNHLCQLRDIITSSRQLVVEIPDNAVRNTEEFRALLASLRNAGIGLSYDAYASGRSQIAERKDIAPDYLKLAPSMFRGFQWGKDRQRQLQMIVRASHDLGSTVIATGIDNKIDLQVCRELGCTLAQGDLFGQPQLLSALAGAPHGAARVREHAK